MYPTPRATNRQRVLTYLLVESHMRSRMERTFFSLFTAGDKTHAWTDKRKKIGKGVNRVEGFSRIA